MATLALRVRPPPIVLLDPDWDAIEAAETDAVDRILSGHTFAAGDTFRASSGDIIIPDESFSGWSIPKKPPSDSLRDLAARTKYARRKSIRIALAKEYQELQAQQLRSEYDRVLKCEREALNKAREDARASGDWQRIRALEGCR